MGAVRAAAKAADWEYAYWKGVTDIFEKVDLFARYHDALFGEKLLGQFLIIIKEIAHLVGHFINTDK